MLRRCGGPVAGVAAFGWIGCIDRGRARAEAPSLPRQVAAPMSSVAPASPPLPGPTPAPRTSRAALLATVGVVLAGILLLVAALVPWWLSDPAKVTAWLRRNVPDLAGSVEMRRATFTLAGPIVFEDVVVVPRDGKREPLMVRRVEVEHGIVRFLLSGGDCGRVRIEGLETHVVFDEDRESNVTGLFAPPGRCGRRRRPRGAARCR